MGWVAVSSRRIGEPTIALRFKRDGLARRGEPNSLPFLEAEHMTRMRDRNIHTYIEDDFERAEEFGKEGHGTVPQVPEENIFSDWKHFSRGKTLGKRVGVAFIPGMNSISPNNMFEIRAINDDNAMALSVSLSPPQVNISALNQALANNISGTQTNQQQNFLGFAYANPFARIEWGIGGILNQCDVDIYNGAAIIINASFVRIGAFVVEPNVAVPNAGYQIAAFIGPGHGKFLGAQRTIQCPSPFPAVGAESVTLAVPLFARRVRLSGAMAGVGAAFSARIRFYRDRAGTLPVAEYLFTDASPQSVFIPNGAYYFRFVGATGPVYGDINAIFDLAI